MLVLFINAKTIKVINKTMPINPSCAGYSRPKSTALLEHCTTLLEHCRAYACQFFLRVIFLALGVSSFLFRPALFFAAWFSTFLEAFLTDAGTFSAAAAAVEVTAEVAVAAVDAVIALGGLLS